MTYKDRLIQNEKYNLLIEKLFDMLSSQGVTRYKVSKLTGIDQTRLSKIYHKKVTLSLNELIKILDAFSFELELKKPLNVKENANQMLNLFKKFIY